MLFIFYHNLKNSLPQSHIFLRTSHALRIWPRPAFLASPSLHLASCSSAFPQQSDLDALCMLNSAPLNPSLSPPPPFLSPLNSCHLPSENPPDIPSRLLSPLCPNHALPLEQRLSFRMAFFVHVIAPYCELTESRDCAQPQHTRSMQVMCPECAQRPLSKQTPTGGLPKALGTLPWEEETKPFPWHFHQ